MRLQSCKGNVLVEFAVILPVFLAILFGTVSFSLALYNKTVLTMATREGARAGAMYVQDQADSSIVSSARTTAELVCQNNLVSFAPGMIPTVTPTITGDILTVSARVTYTGLFIFVDVSDVLISAQTSMRIE